MRSARPRVGAEAHRGSAHGMPAPVSALLEVGEFALQSFATFFSCTLDRVLVRLEPLEHPRDSSSRRPVRIAPAALRAAARIGRASLLLLASSFSSILRRSPSRLLSAWRVDARESCAASALRLAAARRGCRRRRRNSRLRQCLAARDLGLDVGVASRCRSASLQFQSVVAAVRAGRTPAPPAAQGMTCQRIAACSRYRDMSRELTSECDIAGSLCQQDSASLQSCVLASKKGGPMPALSRAGRQPL